MIDETDGKNGAATAPTTASAARNRSGQFTSANPGRPKGARNKTTVAVESLMMKQAKQITKKCLELALAGDLVAIKLVLDRIAPPVKSRPTPFAFPVTGLTPDALPEIYEMILSQVASGDVSSAEALDTLKSLEAYRNAETTTKLIEMVDQLKKGRA